MPKVLITPEKGLFQQPGEGTVSGQLKATRYIDFSVASPSASLGVEDSGKTIVLGSSSGTITFPVDQQRWHATFVMTGSINGDVVISGSDYEVGGIGRNVSLIFSQVTSGSAQSLLIGADPSQTAVRFFALGNPGGTLTGFTAQQIASNKASGSLEITVLDTDADNDGVHKSTVVHMLAKS